MKNTELNLRLKNNRIVRLLMLIDYNQIDTPRSNENLVLVFEGESNRFQIVTNLEANSEPIPNQDAPFNFEFDYDVVHTNHSFESCIQHLFKHIKELDLEKSNVKFVLFDKQADIPEIQELNKLITSKAFKIDLSSTREYSRLYDLISYSDDGIRKEGVENAPAKTL